MVNPQIPWWTWTVPLWPTVLAMIFSLLTGWLRGRRTGEYPSVEEWNRSLLTLLQQMRNSSTPFGHEDRPAGARRADPVRTEQSPTRPYPPATDLDDTAS